MNVNKPNLNELTKEVRRIISSKKENLEDDQVIELIESHIFSLEESKEWSFFTIRKTVEKIFYSIRKDLDILTPFAEEEQVTEIMVNGFENIYVEEKGRLEKKNLSFNSKEELNEVIRRIGAKVRREINELNPILDARLEDGSRVNAVYGNIALNGPILTIRKFPKLQMTMEDLIDKGTITKECATYLKNLVVSGYNCFISGGTSSGKTTFLNVLTDFIPKTERIIVIEDAAELQIHSIDNVVRLETKMANSEGKGQVSMDQLIKTSLRMRPDRIIVGEVRGKEVVDMIQAMNTGHDGSLSTGHGNSIGGMIRRLESMFLQAANFPIGAIQAQIAEGIDIFIHLGRLPDKSRKVLEVSEVIRVRNGEIQVNPLFLYRKDSGLKRTENHLVHKGKLKLRGMKDYER